MKPRPVAKLPAALALLLAICPRAASRSVTRREDVLPTLQALLLLPDPAQAEQERAAPPPVAPTHRRALPVARAELSDRDLPTPVTPPRRLGIELSVLR